MKHEPSSPADPVIARLVGGPFDGRIVAMPGRTLEWEVSEPSHWDGGSPQSGIWVPERQHRYQLDLHWREFVGVEPLPFVYAGVVGGEEGV